MNFKGLLILVIFIFACSNKNSESVNSIWEKATESRKNQDLRLAVTYFKDIIKKYPDSNKAVESQFQIADIYLNDVKDYEIAAKEFEHLRNFYPKSDLTKKAYFMVGYVYSNYLDQYSDAIDTYNGFLETYPDDELVPSVKFELDALNKYQVVIDSLNSL